VGPLPESRCMKKVLLVVIVFVVFVGGFFVYRYFHLHPSDETLIRNFHQNREKFEKSLESDAERKELGIYSIHHGFNGYKNDLVTYLDTSSVSDATQRSVKGYVYSTIDLSQLADKNSVQVFMTDTIGSGVRGDTKGELVNSDTQLFFKPIDKNWYLYLMYTFY